MPRPSTSSDPPPHTYGQSCRLQPVAQLEPTAGLEGIPPVQAQFFYSSLIPIDDPLSAAASTGAADGRASLRPFSAADNIALEKEWISLASARDQENHVQSRQNTSPSSPLSKDNADRLATIIQKLTAKHKERHEGEGENAAGFTAPMFESQPDALETDIPVCCPDLPLDASAELRREFCAVTRKRQQFLDQEHVIQQVMDQLTRSRARTDSVISSGGDPPASRGISAGGTGIPKKALAGSLSTGTSPVEMPLPSRPSSTTKPGAVSTSLDTVLPGSLGKGTIHVRPPILDDGISGRPFVRVETDDASRSSTPAPFSDTPDGQSRSVAADGGRSRSASKVNRPPAVVDTSDKLRGSAEIPVGLSRLHMVSLPVLQMKPIYWSPVNDISVVLRSTWFYEDSMTPVEATVANQLEAGYHELRPWAETWSDEIKSALRVGPEGEEKVSHRLWPAVTSKTSKTADGFPPEPLISSDPFCAARCFRGEAAAEGTLEPVHPAEDCAMPPPESRSYSNYHVIYKNESKAFLLKPSLKPSAYYNRKPVSKIMRGMTVGIPVVRGFDRSAWDRIHHRKATSRRPTAPKARTEVSDEHPVGAPPGCPGCQYDRRRAQITDLVLVAHGIGQKYSKRVESYSFTLAINAFRRAVNVELENEEVKGILRDGQNGIMVLPVNWRLAVSLEEDEETPNESGAVAKEDFTLKDIEPHTIKAVRGIISEVMFDVPFYMSSKHKPKMIAGLVAEANGIMRLWARNHPDEPLPRIHFIGHSLGSVMLLDILSNQPTKVPNPDPRRELDTKHFEFNTTNLFFLGSPVGFFLLLERENLVPRRGHPKPSADPRDTVADGVVGDAGKLGCLPVDNVYNILAREDPIAYHLNGTIDPLYAASLKEAHLPSTATSLFNSMRGMVGMPLAPNVPAPSKPPIVRLPSQLELEVHDFTREEIVEKKVFLLNDNGQVDYFLRSGGGPLEIQYLNMLSAHTSYWTNQDLIRMLCTEIGRKPGRENTLPSMRAVKAGKRVLGTQLRS